MVDIQSITISGSCEENYLEIRLGTETGRVVKKFCAGTQPAEPILTNSNGVLVKWKKKKESTASFTGKWSTKAVACCNKIKLENLFPFSGVYNMDSSKGVYIQEEGGNILFQKANMLGFSGWFVGKDKNSIGIILPVIIF